MCINQLRGDQVFVESLGHNYGYTDLKLEKWFVLSALKCFHLLITPRAMHMLIIVHGYNIYIRILTTVVLSVHSCCYPWVAPYTKHNHRLHDVVSSKQSIIRMSACMHAVLTALAYVYSLCCDQTSTTIEYSHACMKINSTYGADALVVV